MAGPLEGVKVVELGVWVAGPAAGGILADWGADVVKIEPPAGDPARMFGRMLGLELAEGGVNPPFEMDNRSKRSVVLDLGTDARSRDRDRIALRRRCFRHQRAAGRAAAARPGFRDGGRAQSPAGVRADHRLRHDRPRSRPARPTTSPPSGRAPDWRIC